MYARGNVSRLLLRTDADDEPKASAFFLLVVVVVRLVVVVVRLLQYRLGVRVLVPRLVPAARDGRLPRVALANRLVLLVLVHVFVLAVSSGPFWRQVYIAEGSRVQALALSLLVGPGGRSLLLLRQSNPSVRWRKPISSEGHQTSVSWPP